MKQWRPRRVPTYVRMGDIPCAERSGNAMKFYGTALSNGAHPNQAGGNCLAMIGVNTEAPACAGGVQLLLSWVWDGGEHRLHELAVSEDSGSASFFDPFPL